MWKQFITKKYKIKNSFNKVIVEQTEEKGIASFLSWNLPSLLRRLERNLD